MTTESGIILVTGSNRSIGPAVTRRFTDVVGYDRKTPEAPLGCVITSVDITSDASFRQILFTGAHAQLVVVCLRPSDHSVLP